MDYAQFRSRILSDKELLARYVSTAVSAVPDAPFKKTWAELAFKRALRMAVEDGMEKIAWTPGEQQAARYDLSKQVDGIRLMKQDESGGYDIAAKSNGSNEWTPVAKDIPIDKVSDYVGKEIAQKIDAEKSTQSFEGVDLKVGGEGMKGFYDKILPDFARKYVKKWGGKVETTKIKTSNAPNEVVARYANQPDHPFTKNATATVHSVTITPEMRESVMSGQQLFASKPLATEAEYEAIANQLWESPENTPERPAMNEATLRRVYEKLSKKSGFPAVSIADLLEGAGFLPGGDTMARAKGILAGMAKRNEARLGLGDWSLSSPREKAWAVVNHGNDRNTLVELLPKGSAIPGAREAQVHYQKSQWLHASKPIAERLQMLSDATGWTSIVDDIQKVLAPDERLTAAERAEFLKTGDFSAIGDARKTGNVVRGITAEMDRRRKQFEASLKELRGLVDKLPLAQKHELQRRIDEGTPLKPGAIGDAVKELVKLDKAKAQELKDFLDSHGMEHWQNFQNFEKYIVPHAFTDQAEAAKVVETMLREKKVAGGTGFLKHREGFTIREIQEFAKSKGIDLVPKHDNIVDAVMDRWTQQERYMGAHQMIDQMVQNGSGHWEGADYQPKPGEKMVNNIIGNRTVEAKNPDSTTSRRRQHFFAAEPSAQVVNNYLSRGLRTGHKWVENYFLAANILNSAQLGLSFFHGGFVTMEGMVSNFANGLRKVLAGDLSGLKDIALSPGSTWHDWKLGGTIREEMLNPGKFGAQHMAVVNAMVSAGFRDGVDSFYQDNHISKLMSAFREKRYLPALLRAPWALIELMAKPIMEHYVPRLKAAAIYKMAQTTLKRSPNLTAARLHDSLAKDVESGNNRFGQMTYDNLHLHKIVKDLLMGLTRSLGWNWGTFSELGGGIGEWLKFAANATRATGDRLRGAGDAARAFPEVTNKMAYTLALPLLVGLMGAVLSAMFGKTPKELKDYYFIQTGETDDRGNPVRVVLPSYMKDVFHAAHDPASTVTNKLHPLLSTIGAMLQNKDFYGVEIRHAGDPVLKQILQELGYAGKQFIPFTGRNAAKYAGAHAPAIVQVGGFLGLTQAPARMGKSEAQNLADEINAESMPTKTRTSAEAERTQTRSQIIALMRQGRGQTELADAQRKGLIGPSDLHYLQRMAKLTPLQASVSRLSLNDAEKVMEKATAAEIQQLQPIMLAKRANAEKRNPGATAARGSSSVWDRL